MKKLLISLVLIPILLLAACSPPDPRANLINVREAVGVFVTNIQRYTLFLPEGWEPTIATGMVAARHTEDTAATVTVIRGSLGGQTQLTPVWEDIWDEFTETFDDYYIVYSTEPTESGEPSKRVNGFPAFRIIYTATVAGVESQFLQVLVLRGGSMYLITYTNIPAKFAEHIDDINLMLEHFTFARNPETPAGMTPHYLEESSADPTPGFNVYMPNHWLADVSLGHVFIRPPGTDTTNLTILTAPTSLSLHGYALAEMAAIYAQFEMTQPAFDQEHQADSPITRRAVTIDGRDAYRYEFSLEVGGVTYNFLQFLLVENGTAFILTFTGVGVNFTRNQYSLNIILENFTFQ